MLFRDAAGSATLDLELQDILRAVWPTTGTPPSFAPPIDVRDDGELIRVAFAIGRWSPNRIEVEVRARELRLVGRSPHGARAAHSLRVFTLAVAVDPSTARTEVDADVLVVEARKAGRSIMVVRRR